MVLGFYCFAGHQVLSRMRLEVLSREATSRWVVQLLQSKSAEAGLRQSSLIDHGRD
jgi:hypothetical protein